MNAFYRNYGKRMIDIVLSFVALIILAPLLIIIGVLVYFKLGSPILFTQERPGKDGEVFKLYKFRTMTAEKDGTGTLLPDSVRLTKFGKFLRSTSLDELPELWNILIGDMSIVGPRPLLVQYLPLYNNHQKRRHDVRPGLTGYAQVNGRNALSWQEKFNYDVEYVDKINFLLDTQIVFKTIKQVLIKDGISSETSATMEAFKGNGNE
ncbi:sugar transferase [Aerococcus urinaeequi]|uniref:sugar transferase n=1 Tax=Aerococcus urinaeequi TaxID=51665 RepID=UPI003ED9A484